MSVHRSAALLVLALPLLLAACDDPSTPTSTPTPTLEQTVTPQSAPSGTLEGPFDEADLRALLSGEEIEAAIALVIGDTHFLDFKALGVGVDPDQAVGWDSGLILSFTSVGGSTGLTLAVTDFESLEFVAPDIATVKALSDVEPTDSTIGDESLQGQGGGVVSVMFWKDDKAVQLHTSGLPETKEVLEGLIALAKLAASRL